MSLLDWIRDASQSVNDSINQGLADVLPKYGEWMQQQEQAASQGVQPYNSAPEQDLAGLNALASNIPGWDPLMKVLDSGRRGAETVLISAQYADSKAKGDETTSWGDFFNRSTWSRAWDYAAFDNPERVVTGGALLSAAASGQDVKGLDPFDAAEADMLQKKANSSWFGRTMTTTSDLGLSFIAPPGMGAVARARKATGINTLAQADAVAARFTEAGVVKQGLGAKATETLRLMLPNGAQNVDTLVARQVEGLRQFESLKGEYAIFNSLKSRLPTAPDGEIAKLANVFSQIGKVADPAVRDRLRMNAFLSSMGSATAKANFIAEAPLIAKNFEGLTTVPRETQAYAELFTTRLEQDGDVPVNAIMERTWGTASDKAELEAIRAEIKARRNALSDHRRLIDELKALKPKTRNNPDAVSLADRRAAQASEVRRIQAELKQARADLHGTRRWAAGSAKTATTQAKAGSAAGIPDVQDFHTALGDARRRVESLQADLAAARSDRALLDSTPMPGWSDIADWHSMVDEARVQGSALRGELNAAKAKRDAVASVMETKKHEIAAARSRLDAANHLINDILDVGGADATMTLVGDAKPTALARLKEHMREQVGAEHYITFGDGNAIMRLTSLPSRRARQALAPAARGQINLNEVGLGARQLEDTMARSRVFGLDEIAKMRNDLIRTQGMDRAGIVAHVQDVMVERMAQRFFATKGRDLTPEQATKAAKEITGLTKKAWGQGNDWITKSAGEQLDQELVAVRDLDGTYTGFDGPSLRSQMADHAPILDPWDLNRALSAHERTFIGNARNGMHAVTNAHDYFVSVWKVAALVRPGLMVRSMLDTGPRALASMTATESLMASLNGAANLIHNKGLKGLAKVEFHGLTLEEAAAKARYLGLKPVRLGKHDYRFAEDVADLQAKLSATSKGQTVHGALFHEMAAKYDSLRLDRASWARRKPDSELWHLGYKEYADMLLASPTARRLADMLTTRADGADLAAIRERIKGSPEFTAEYRQYAQPMGRTRSEFLAQLVNEVGLMFPSERALTAAKSGGLSKKFVDSEFPLERRFEVPSPEISAMEGSRLAKAAKAATDKAFQILLDKPDMWLARNPTAVQLYNRNLRREYESLLARHGKDYELTLDEVRTIDARARNEAIGYVRSTFFDTTRYTGMHRSVARFSPFIGAWEDAMMSWGRLIYDDPRRLVKLQAAYYSPYTVQQSNQIDLVVDENGQPLKRGQSAEQVSVMVPAVVAKAIARTAGMDPSNVGPYRIRLDAINSIAQGETWWLPGVGPSVAMGATYALGSGNVIPRDVALDLIDTKSPVGQAILKSVFLGGEIPPSDVSSIAQQALPGWVKTVATQAFGTGATRNRQTTFNYLVGEALANGQQLSSDDYVKLWERADRSANAAAVVRLAMSAGLGMTGSADVDGQFYVDQMHLIYAMPSEQRNGLTPEEFFAQKFPEAADLDWSITRNETGINATVQAAKAEVKLAGLLKRPENRAVGWMILGADNVADEEFSRTAYAMQRSDGNRIYLTPEEAQMEAQAAVGTKLYFRYSEQALQALVAMGMTQEEALASKQYRAVRKAVKEKLKADNPAYAAEQAKFEDRFDEYLNHARRFSSSGQLKDRPDMQTFRLYDQARSDVMARFKLSSLAGTTEKTQQAKALLMRVGSELAQRDTGFQQMWDKFLEGEVD